MIIGVESLPSGWLGRGPRIMMLSGHIELLCLPSSDAVRVKLLMWAAARVASRAF